MVRIAFEHDRRFLPVCSGCRQKVASVHSSLIRGVQDLSIAGRRSLLEIPSRKLRCSRCGGVRAELHDFVDTYGRLTHRLVRAVEELVQHTSIEAVAAHFGLSWHTVKEIDKRRLQREAGTPNYDGLRILAVDEIAVHKGHRYKTIVLDYESGRAVWVGDGRSSDTLKSFFSELSAEQLAGLQAIAVDMSPSYTEAIRSACPNAAIVYDLFHVVAKYAREVIDRVRVDEFRKSEGRGRELLKGSKYLLLSNRSNLSRKDRWHLKDLMAANERLNMVYVMRDQLKHIWSYRSEAWAFKAIFGWCLMAEESGIAALRKFGKGLKKFARGILNHCRYPIHTSRIEGVNNRIKVIKRMAYGFRDDEYFALKIKGAFPGKKTAP